MGSSSFRLQEFVAHGSNVNCLKFGRKSKQVLVTGGDDRNVNMWRVNKPTNILSLSGHQSPVESVTFDRKEEKVVAGSQGGSLKCFDLQEAKVFRTLTGHMSSCVALDYHPYGQFIASGSSDTNMKIWDIRSKVCIQTYKGHSKQVTCVQFSPDGRWVASGGQDGTVKIWDLTAGKLLQDFTDHVGPITAMEFNPREFLLSTASADKTIKVHDLERFELLTETLPDTTKLRALTHSKDGQFVFGATHDTVKKWQFDHPVQCLSCTEVGWRQVADLVLCETEDAPAQLLGASFHTSFVSIHVVNYDAANSGSSGAEQPAAVREPPFEPESTLPIRTKPMNTSPAMPVPSELNRREQAFDDRHKASSSCVPEERPWIESRESVWSDPMQQQQQQPIEQRTKSSPSSSSSTTATSAQPPPRQATPPPTSALDKAQQRPTSSDRPTSSSAKKNSPSKPSIVQQHPHHRNGGGAEPKFPIQTAVVVTTSSDDKTVATAANADANAANAIRFSDFVAPEQQQEQQQQQQQQRRRQLFAPAEIFAKVAEGRDTFSTALTQRLEALQNVTACWREGDIKGAVRELVCMKPKLQPTIAVDFFRAVEWKNNVFDLDTCAQIMPLTIQLFKSSFPDYIETGLKASTKLFLAFSPIVQETRRYAATHASSRHVDLSQEDRLRRCNVCFDHFDALRGALLTLKQTNQHKSLVEPIETLNDMLHSYFTR